MDVIIMDQVLGLVHATTAGDPLYSMSVPLEFLTKTRMIRGGKPIPKKLYDEKDTHRMGLNLRRGPDPRSRATGLRSI